MKLRDIYYSLTPEMRLLIRKVYFFPQDVLNVFRTTKDIIPKKGDIYIGSGDFTQQGESQVKLLVNLINLQSSDVVLDIGSGIGRTAIPLTKILFEGKYEGFDVVKKGVDWCLKNITSRFSNFNFTFIPLHNDLYNSYENKASNFSFPYADNYFDKIFLFSVFTHMKIDEIKRYFFEIKRVIKVDGLCLSTFFLYDDSSEKRIENNGEFSFPHSFDEGYKLMNAKVQSANIAISMKLLGEMLEEAGLELIQFEKGYWDGLKTKREALNFQDIIIIKSK